MRIIPKKTKVKTDVFKGFKAIDLIILIVFIALIGLVLLSNIPGKLVYASIMAVLAFLGLLSIDEEKMYVFVINAFIHIFKSKIFVKNASSAKGDIQKIMPYTKIENGMICFGSDYVAKVIEIEPMEFRLLDEYKQDKLIDTLAIALKSIGAGQKLQLVKIDRPLILDEFISNTEKKIVAIQNAPGYSEVERAARIELLNARMESLKLMNDGEKIPVCHFYLVCLSMLGSCSAFAMANAFTLQNGGFDCQVLENTAELANFIKYQYSYNFNERETSKKYGKAERIESLAELFPQSVKIKANHIEIDNKKIYQYAVTDFPITASNAWGYNLFNMPGTRVVLNIDYMDKLKAEKMIDNSVLEIELKQKYAGKASAQISNDVHMESLIELMNALKTDNEVLLNCSVYVSYFDDSIEGMTRQEVKRSMRNDGFKISDNLFRQSQAFISSNISRREEVGETKRGINSSSLAAIFPFVSNKMLEPSGILVGYNGMPVSVDFFKRTQTYKNSNTMIIGSSGSGKSFATKTIMSNLAADNMRVFVLDPENEYSELAQNMGGRIVDMSSGESKINPLQVMSNMVDSDENSRKSPLTEHLQFLQSFYDVIFPEMTPLALEQLNKLTEELYARFSITAYTMPIELEKIKAKSFPLFTDLAEYLTVKLAKAKNDRDEFLIRLLREIDIYVSKLVAGGRFAMLWNAPTNLVADTNFMCFNFQGLLASSSNTLAEAQMLLLTRFLNNEIVINFNRYKHLPYNEIPKFLVVIDEAHVFFNSRNTLALDFIRNNSKRVRKYGGMQIVITQSIRDFIATESIASAAKSVVTESQYSLIFPLSAGNLDDLLQLYKGLDLNLVEQQDIMANGRGTCFMISSQYNRTNIEIVASETTRLMFGDTDMKKELEIRAEKEKNAMKKITIADIANDVEQYYDEYDGGHGEADQVYLIKHGEIMEG